MDILFSAWTVLVGAVFLGIVIWTLGRGRSEEFEQASRIPLEDDDAPGARAADAPQGD